MQYDELRTRLESMGRCLGDIAEANRISLNAVHQWRNSGVPHWVRSLVTAWETEAFLRDACREFNLRVAELAVHSAELTRDDK